MAAQPTRRKFTVDEYFQMGKTGILGPEERVELIKGEIIRVCRPGDPGVIPVCSEA
jgi:hypothetical protein